MGPIIAAHDARNKAEPRDHLVCHTPKSVSKNMIHNDFKNIKVSSLASKVDTMLTK